MTWVFLLLFTLPSFGGPVTVRFEFTTEDGCRRIQKVVVRELAEAGSNKYQLVECYTNGPYHDP